MEPKALRAKVETRREGWRAARCAGRRGRRGAGAAAVMDGPIRRRGGAAALIEQRAAPRDAHTRAPPASLRREMRPRRLHVKAHRSLFEDNT